MKSFFRTLVARILRWEASCILRKYHPRIVGITGNVGKTSAKDMIAAVLSTGFTVRKSAKSYNSEIGIPLTILGQESGWMNPLTWCSILIRGFLQVIGKTNYPQWLVLELGVDHPNDMQSAISFLSLDVAVMTGMSYPPVHLEFFKSPEDLYEEKGKIIDGLRTGGFLVVNYDDRISMELAGKSRQGEISFGFHKGAGILASNHHVSYREEDGRQFPEGITFKLDYQAKSLPVRLPGAAGKNMIYAALAAIAVGMTQKLNTVEMIAALATAEKPRGRLRLLRGCKESIVIDDTYNSSPTASQLALETLKELETKGRRIAVLGDMLELGTLSESAHRDAGELAAKTADLLIVVGTRARMIGEGALDSGFDHEKLIRFPNSKVAAEKIGSIIESGDLILVKGSQGARMEHVVKALLAEPARASELLVRQEKVWNNR